MTLSEKMVRMEENTCPPPELNGGGPQPASVAPVAPKDRHEAVVRERMSLSDKIMSVATVVIALGTVVSAMAIYLQWREMVGGESDTSAIKTAAQQQVAAAKDFASTAVKIDAGIADAVTQLGEQAKHSGAAIGTTRDAVRLDERAWVVVKGTRGAPELNKVWQLETVFTNTGRTPSKDTRISCNIEAQPPGAPYKFNEVKPGAPVLMVPGQEDYCVLYPTVPPVINPDALDKIRNRKLVIALFGTVTYKDIFNKAHWYKFCRQMKPDGNNWENCDTGNGDDFGDGLPPRRSVARRNE